LALSGWPASLRDGRWGHYISWNMLTSTNVYNLPPSATPSQVRAAFRPSSKERSSRSPPSFLSRGWCADPHLRLPPVQKIDSTKFSLPSNLLPVLAVGVVVATIGVVPTSYVLPSFIAQAHSRVDAFGILPFRNRKRFPNCPRCERRGLLMLVGMIGGLVLGLWRLGERYNETLLKIGASDVGGPLSFSCMTRHEGWQWL
jgi:hypothetical protein